jgi:hypothetical protein
VLSRRVATWLRTRLTGSTAEAATFFRAAGALVSRRGIRGPDYLAARFIPWSIRWSTVVKIPVVRRLAPVLLDGSLPGPMWSFGGFVRARVPFAQCVEASDG